MKRATRTLGLLCALLAAGCGERAAEPQAQAPPVATAPVVARDIEERIGASWGNTRGGLFFEFGRAHTAGILEVNDAYTNYTAALRVDLEPIPDLVLTLTGRYINSVLGIPKHRGHGRIVGIANHADALHAGNQFGKQFHQLGTEIDLDVGEASDIASRSRQTGDEPGTNWICD